MKIFLYILLSIFPLLQDNNYSVEGKYEYKSNFYYESIELFGDKRFIYYYKNEFISNEITGNFNHRGDSIILDSSPQRDKLIVRENRKEKQKNVTILVTDKMGEPFHYSLYVILPNDSAVSIRDQWFKTNTQLKNIKGFYIVDSKGLQSPRYYARGRRSNCFEVQFETKRVFENESWYIQKNRIMPRSMKGDFQKYFLEKIDLSL